jgi:short subunit dehydrogenase-like uncharacterized protein
VPRQHLLIYGATGYTGRLIVRRALARGLRPIIAGRDRQAIASMAASCGVEWMSARVDDAARLRSLTSAANVLINAAAPFVSTSAALVDACIATGTHFLDITGEAESIEATAKWHDEAVQRRVMLMPGAGFDVVASDCLAAHVARRLPGARVLKLGFDISQPISRGSLKTSIEMAGRGVLVRRGGRLVRVAQGSLAYCFDYGYGPRVSLGVNLGDVSTAFFTTGIPNIETYLRATLPVWGAITTDRYWGWLLATLPWQTLLKAQTTWLPDGPSPQARSRGWAIVVADANDSNGRCVRARLRTADRYWFTALSTIGIAERILAGESVAGFQTPASVLGPDFARTLDGVSQEDF